MAAKSKSAETKAKRKVAGGKKKGGTKKATAKPTIAGTLEDRLDQLTGEMDRLAAQAKQAIATSEKEYGRILNELGTKRAAAQEELDRLVNKGDTALHDVSAGFEKAAKDLDQAIRKAFSRFS